MLTKINKLLISIFVIYAVNSVNPIKEDIDVTTRVKAVDIKHVIIETVKENGYPIEEHHTTTSDGYILHLHRIPYGKQSPFALNKTVVFLQHGIICTSSDWIVLGPENSLAYILADSGYDVWMGNARGNTYSKKHIKLTPKTTEFWNFSFHEIGFYDLPAMIDYVLENTGQEKLHYVGHSQGTCTFFVMCSMRPKYNKKILSMQALAPIAFMSNIKSPFIRATAPFVDQLQWIVKMLGLYEFFPTNEMMIKGGSLLCKDSSLFQEVCVNALFLIAGYNSAQLNRTILPTILSSTPAGASVNQFIHFGQEINSGHFRMFDHGLLGNFRNYLQFSPPDYELNKVTAPVFLHYSDNDWLSATEDVEKLAAQLGNLIQMIRVPDPLFNHLDYTYGTDARTLLYNKLISIIQMN